MNEISCLIDRFNIFSPFQFYSAPLLYISILFITLFIIYFDSHLLFVQWKSGRRIFLIFLKKLLKFFKIDKYKYNFDYYLPYSTWSNSMIWISFTILLSFLEGLVYLVFFWVQLWLLAFDSLTEHHLLSILLFSMIGSFLTLGSYSSFESSRVGSSSSS